VTPSATVLGCSGLDPAQLVDGGYTDNTGLGTINGLGDLWSEVQQHNDQVLADGAGDLIVPHVVFLENGAGAEYSVTTEEQATEAVAEQQAAPASGGWWPWPAWLSVPEVLVPPVGSTKAEDHKVRTNRALARSRSLVLKWLCTPPPRGGHAEAAAADRTPALACLDLLGTTWARHPVFVVHQDPQPSISAPLGWSLSEASKADLDKDMDVQADNTLEDLSNEPASRAGYGTLKDLLIAIGQPAS
jgi:hypothetical protein